MLPSVEDHAARNVGLHKGMLSLYLDVYRHHFDLFIKGGVIYLAIMATLAGYIFRAEVTRPTQATLMLFAAILSLLGIAGCRISRAWVKQLSAVVNDLSKAVSVPQFPFSGAVRITILIELMCSVFLLVALASAWIMIE